MGKTSKLARTLHSAFRETRDLRIRDHVAHFLAIEPIYCALEIPSYELLDVVKGSEDRYEAAQRMFEFVRNLVNSQSPQFNSNVVRIEKTASSAYSIILPQILHSRIQELRNCRVPYTTKISNKYERTLYYIGHLLNTRYGDSIIRTFPKSEVKSVIGKELWNQISRALNDIGFEPDSKYEEIPSDDWYLHVKSLDNVNSKAPLQLRKEPSDEIEALRHLDAVIRAWEFEGLTDSLRVGLLGEIENLRTRHYNKELIQQFPTLASYHKRSVIDLLISTLDPAAEDLLNSYLESVDPRRRKFAARGLARLNALKSPLAASDPTKADLIDVAELMASSIAGEQSRRSTNSGLFLLARSKIPQVRKDVARILLELHDKDTREIFFHLVTDSNEEVAFEVLSHIEKVPPQLAKDILRRAFDSIHSKIVTMAEAMASDLDALE
jgi:hypothetical protein